MTLSFRNIDVSPDDPVKDWPTAAIRADPWGPVARRVAEALTVSEAYGVDVLMTDAITGAQAAQAERVAVVAEITRLVAGSGLSRAEFAALLGPGVSRVRAAGSRRRRRPTPWRSGHAREPPWRRTGNC